MTEHPAHTTAMLFLGGKMEATPRIPPVPHSVVAADSGYDHALAAGIGVDLLVGDLDSISDPALAHARRSGVRIERHSADKDATDTELALDLLVELGVEHVDMYGGEGGEFPHLLGVVGTVAADRYEAVRIRWHIADGTIETVRPHQPFAADVADGTRIGIVAVTDAAGVETTGLAWPLQSEDLQRGTSRGLSNRSNETQVTVTVESGVLLIHVEGQPSR